MPEIKNTFNQGKMNKDLDERIIPNGQYRDAMNIQVSTSEGSDVGTVQNILGNTSIENVVGLSGYKCIGSVADEKNNKLYWFVKGNSIDAILECSDEDVVKPVLIDTKVRTTNAVLKFGDDIITSINIIDNLLLWTDNKNEPRKININRCKKGNPRGSLQLDSSPPHTKLVVNDEIYVRTTISRSNQSSTGAINQIEFLSVDGLRVGDRLIQIRNWIGRLQTTKNVTITDITRSTVTLSEDILGSSYLSSGDSLKFSREEDITEEHITVIKKRPLRPLSVKITSAEKNEKDTLFENIFPRFSYRYKYVDGEYSAFAPFTDIAFNSLYGKNPNGVVDYNPTTAYDEKEPYNAGMRNMIKSIELTDFISPNIPKDVVQVDILYKQEDSNVVYIVKAIKKDSDEWSASGFESISRYKGKYNILSENIHAALPENQLLRPWDNVPRKALAQEVTGNRVVYGNYTQNYTNDIDTKLVSDYRLRFPGTNLSEVSYIWTDNLIENGTFADNDNPLILDHWTLGANIIWINNNPGVVGNHDGKEIKFNYAPQGEKLIQYNIPDITVGETYRITLDVNDMTQAGGELDGKLVDGEGNYIEFTGIKYRSTMVFEAEMEDKGGSQLGASFYNSFFIQASGNSDFKGFIDTIKVEKREVDDTFKTFEDGGFPSIKSQRNYQLGVIYGDKYGRETPVFTSQDSSISIPWEDITDNKGKLASQSLQLFAHINSPHPEWADYYKFYIKETSGEYYNLVMDAVYNPTKDDLKVDDHLWISFASSDRNKISEDSYLVLKKRCDQDSQVEEENKFKILDIKNEAPDAIKYRYLTLGEVPNTGSGTAGDPGVLSDTDANVGLFWDVDKRPIITNANPAPQILHFKKATWEAQGGQPITDVSFTDGTGSLVVNNTPDLYFSFTKIISDENQISSKKYKIASVQLNANNTYIVRLNESITQADSDLAEADAGAGIIHELITVRIERKDTKDLEAFSGRFFVKILSNSQTKNKLEHDDTLRLLANHVIDAERNTRWLTDIRATTFNSDDGLINQQPFNDPHVTSSSQTRANEMTGHSGGNLTRTESDWDAVHKLLSGDRNSGLPFIDNMYAAATQLDFANGYARKSGQGWVGGNPETVEDIFHGPLPQAQTSGTSIYNETSGQSNIIAYPNENTMRLTNVSSGSTTANNGENLVNGLEGVITTNNIHTGASGFGRRRWRTSIHSSTVDNTYGNENGKHYLHLSFMGCGKNLHDGQFPTGGMAIYPNAGSVQEVICNHLQGIWGGGVFTRVGGLNFPGSDGPFCRAVFMEGTHTSSHQHASTPPYHGYNDENPSGSTGRRWLHNNQWKPWLPDGSYYKNIEEFINKLQPDQTFVFEDDPDKTRYTIIKVREKRLYNHTPWRKSYEWDPNPGGWASLFGFGGQKSTGDSVEDAVVDWAESRSNSISGKTPSVGDQTKYDIMKQKIIDFGNRNNRRVCYILELDKDITAQSYNPVDGTTLDATSYDKIQFLTEDFDLNSGEIVQNPAVWETEPKENVDLDIYYEASQAYPVKLTQDNKELFAPIGCEVQFIDNPQAISAADTWSNQQVDNPIYLTSWKNSVEFTLSEDINQFAGNQYPQPISYSGSHVKFIKKDGSYTVGVIAEDGEYPAMSDNEINNPGLMAMKFDTVTIEPYPSSRVGLSWSNCFSFGNGVESNRIKDDFNAMVMSNGVRASSTIEQPYAEEHRKNGLIYSGIFNSTNGVNNLNEFITAEKITKDLNPTYGSIQKLYSRVIRQSSSLIAFCEDKVVSIISNKNALYNADGNPQVVASNAVLGDANAFVGDYGISKNPESFAKETYRAYFTDKQRGAVLRLSMDGITPISDAGMHDYFRDNLKAAGKLIGTYDAYKQNYNLTLSDFLPNNIVKNETFGVGESFTEYFNTEDLIVDGGFTSGVNRYIPPIPTNVANNSDLDSETTITNHSEIIQGSLQTEQIEKTAYNWSYGNPSGGNQIIYHADFENVVYGDAFNTVVGETTMKADAVEWQGYVSSSAPGFFGMNSNDDPFLRNSDGGAAGVVRIWAKGQDLSGSLVHPPVSGINNVSASHLASQTNTNYFPNSINSTIFHQEEYKVTFKIQNYLNSANLTHYTQTGGVASDNDINVEIALWSDQSGSAGKLYNTHADGTTPFFVNGTATASTAEDYSAGWLTSSTHEFVDVPLGNSTFSFYFTLDGEEGTHIDTSATENMLTAPIADFFNIHFKNTKSNWSENNLIVKNLKIEKIKKVTNPGNNFSQPLVPEVPASLVAAWAEVDHTAVNDWAASNSNIILNQFAIDKYGDNTGSGTSVPYDIINPTTGAVTGSGNYIDGTPNNDTTYNEYSDGVYVEDGFLEAITVGGNVATEGYLTQTISGISIPISANDPYFDPIVPMNSGSWYEVRLIGVVGSGGLLVSDVLDDTSASGTILDGHLGFVASNVNNVSPHIRFDNHSINPTYWTENSIPNDTWITRFKYSDSNSGSSDLLKLHFYSFTGTIDTIEFYDITAKEMGGTLTEWGTHSYSPTIYHSNSPSKTIYHDGSQVHWENGVQGDWLTQSFSTAGGSVAEEITSHQARAQDIGSSPPVTEDGYKLRFTIESYTSGSLSGYITGAEDAVNTGEATGIEFLGINQAGYWQIEFNMDGTATSIVKYTDSTFNTPQSIQSHLGVVNTKIVTTPTYGSMNKIVFNIVSGGDFTGTIDSISLKDATNYFLASSTGDWIFDGFDQTLENYIYWDSESKNIVFENAPDTVSLRQSILEHSLITGSDVSLSFNVNNVTSGSISGYFYNERGEGFVFGPISADGVFTTGNVIMGDDDAAIGDSSLLRDTLVVYVDNEPFSGELDNFELHRTYPNFVPSTVTFSEDVSGWTSFKSFIPETGVSLSKNYYTMKDGKVWKHHIEQFNSTTGKEINRNTFYSDPAVESTVTAILNAEPSAIKIFNTITYEGTQSKVYQYVPAGSNTSGLSNIDAYNLSDKDGWHVNSIITDKQAGSVREFIEKEGKWFNYIRGDYGDTKTSAFSFQGLGIVSNVITLN